MPDIGTMHQLNPEPPHIGTMHQLGPEPLHTGEIITPQAQAEEYAREAQASADNAALSAAAAQSAAETAQQAAESIAPALDTKAPVVCNTASGAIASFTDGADDMPLRECVAGIEPAQDLHGYDHPWPAGGGKNLIDKENFSTSKAASVTPIAKGVTVTVVMAGNNRYAISELPVSLLGKTITIHADVSVSGTNYAKHALYFGDESGATTSIQIINGTGSKTTTIQVPASLPEGSTRLLLLLYACTTGVTSVGLSATYDNLQVEIGSEATDYAPYSNICPITGWTGAKVYHSGADTSNPTELDITFPSEAGTVYGGSLNVMTGVLTVDRAQIASYNGETLPGEWISDRDVYAPGTTPTTGAQVVYELATPITYTLTPQEIRTLLGANNIWADTGDVTVGYKADTKLYIDKKFAELQALILEH